MYLSLEMPKTLTNAKHNFYILNRGRNEFCEKEINIPSLMIRESLKCLKLFSYRIKSLFFIRCNGFVDPFCLPRFFWTLGWLGFLNQSYFFGGYECEEVSVERCRHRCDPERLCSTPFFWVICCQHFWFLIFSSIKSLGVVCSRVYTILLLKRVTESLKWTIFLKW